MILTIKGEISPYYVQTLCLLFFPGAKFALDEKPGPGIPEVHVTLTKTKTAFRSVARLSHDGKTATAEGKILRADFPNVTEERLSKIAVGRAVFGAGKALLGNKSPWGILTGVRPAKVAGELLNAGNGVLKTKQILRDEYFVNPKKASLVVSVASSEAKLLRSVSLADTCSLYVSVPFCPSRCAYCSFISAASEKMLSMLDDYLQTLYADLDNIAAVIRSLGKRVSTVYIGGGTPTVLSEKQLAALLERIGKNVDVSSLDEFTLEAGRPDTFTKEKLAIAKEAGVSRISVNPQTLSDDILKAVGRRHSVDDFFRAYHLAKASGIRDINVDLIAGLPGDTFGNFSYSLDTVLSLAPSNITVHSLSIKNAADIRSSASRSADVAETAKCVDYSQLRTKNAGYRPYYMYRQKNTVGNLENVGYAQEGCEGLYNVFMMEELHSIFSVGAGAVTKLVQFSDIENNRRKIERIFTPKYPYEYLREAEKIRAGDAEGGLLPIGDRIRAFFEKNG